MTASGNTRQYFLPLAIKTIALISIYATYGLLQERIIKGHYKDADTTSSAQKFRSAPLLVLCNRITSLITGLILTIFHSVNINSSQLPKTNTKSQQPPQIWTILVAKTRPSSPLLHYAIVAFLNNAATVSQYTSLSYLSFTTSTLAKSAKMVPVLILGHLWYGKRYKSRQWIGALIVILGIWGYLNSLVKVDGNGVVDESKTLRATNWIGISCLMAYLFFDGLTSTMQERLFGEAKGKENSSTLWGITRGVVDQMIWVNFFSSIIALTMLLLSPSTTTLPSIKLVLSSPTLQLHILLLSITATSGLLVLFHVIATYGALIASMIMTIRQFICVVFNAAWFGNMAEIPLLGWLGIGVMAAGVWIKMDRRWDDYDRGDGRTGFARARLLMCQYVLPLVVCPLTFTLLVEAFEFTRLGDARASSL